MSEYTIQELTQLSGVPRRNVYFYTQQGILPPPQGAGLGARYSDVHLLRLRAIPVLRNQGLRLDQIRERLMDMATDEVRRLTENPNQRLSLLEAAFPVLPALPGTNYIHYPLPGGVTLVVPETLPAAERQKVEQLREAAARIWSQPSVPPTITWRDSDPTSANESPEIDPDERKSSNGTAIF